MLSRVFACWLAILVIVPFTAPFPTCDLACVLGKPPRHRSPAASRAKVASTNSVAVPRALFVSNAGRVRRLCRAAFVPSDTHSSSATMLTSSVASIGGNARERTTLRTILRI